MPNISSTWTNPQSAALDLAGYVAGGYAGDIVKASWWSAFVSNEQYLFDRLVGESVRVQCLPVTRFTDESTIFKTFVTASITIARPALVLFHIDERIGGSSGFNGYWGVNARFTVNGVVRQIQNGPATPTIQQAAFSFWYAGLLGAGTYSCEGAFSVGNGTDVGTTQAYGEGSALIIPIYLDK